MARYTEKEFASVTIEKNIAFAELPAYDEPHAPIALHMDVYAPEGDTETDRRSVILVHGGGFLNGDKEQGYIVTLGKLLAQYGYVCFAVDYRLFLKEIRPKYPTAAPYAAMDIECARQFIV